MTVRVTFYEVNIDDEEGHACAVPTLAEAKTVRRESGTPGLDGDVYKVVALAETMRELACALFNRQHFAEKRTRIIEALPEDEETEPC